MKYVLSGTCYVLLWFISCLTCVNVYSQSAVSAGSGSYASSVPTNQYGLDEYYGLGIDQVISYYNLLHMDSSKQGTPIPTNHWWTDMLVADRSYIPTNGTTRTIVQDPYGGQLWFYPGMIQARSYGLDVYFPNSWVTGTTNAPQGNFDSGTVLPVAGTLPATVGSSDILIADFEGSSYPSGWTTTGTAFGTGPTVGGSYPGQSPAVSGYVGNACANSYAGSNAATGTLVSPSFTISKHYIAFLVGGGNDTGNDYVGLVINGNTVLRAAGQQDATLRWIVWDVSAYSGQTATIQLVDTSTAGWGFILADFFVQTDNGGDPSVRYTTTFTAPNATVMNWGDWTLDFRLKDILGNYVDTTLARGTPFIWTRWNNAVKPSISIGAGNSVYNSSATVINTSSGTFSATNFAFDYNGRTFGIFLPTNTTIKVVGNTLIPQLTGTSTTSNFMVIGLLPNKSYLSEFAGYAYARPTGSTYSWSYSKAGGSLSTTFTLSTSSLQSSQTNTLMGWLPHHYRTTTSANSYKAYTYLTPRGAMKVTAGTSGTVTYPFRGIAPMLPAPKVNGLANDYNVSRMNTYIANFAPTHPGNIADTYWGGKDLAISAQFLGFANQLQNSSNFMSLKTGLKSKLTDWMSYTPGESQDFFAMLPNWGALIGFQASYGTQAFNDNHFHYGYYALACALYGIYDQSFITNYGPMATLVAKQYANWDRTDTRFPFLRTFDVWEGHSNAGGVSSPTGENQESSSEAINSWVGLFMLGAQLNNDAMVAAGVMGYTVESNAVNEYWQNMYGTNLPSNYYVYGSQVTGVGIVGSGGSAYGTFFSGDPAWIYGIQNTPPNHWNNYLVRGNKTFAQNQLNSMYSERSQVSAINTPLNNPYVWTLGSTTNDAAGMGEGLGNVILEWQTMFDPNTVASLMDQYYAAGDDVAVANTNPGVTYYLTHILRGLGDPDPNYYTDMPTSAVYYNSTTGQRNYVIYNSSTASQTVNLYNNGTNVGSVVVAPRSLYSNFEIAPSMAGVNLAANKTTTVSSVENTGMPGSAAVDGNQTTRWSTAFSDPQWIEVDLGATYPLTEIRLNWETACGKNYLLQVSNDGNTWTTVTTVSGNTTAGLLTYPVSTSGRYVRMYGTARATQWGYSLYEFEVYGLPDANIALNQPVTASSVQAAGNAAANAVDGNTGTRWESQYSDPQWIYVDLGSVRSIHSVQLDWETACGENYLLQVSNDANAWTTVATVSGNVSSGWLTYPGLNTSGRYVRMYGTARATAWGYSLFEFQVFGQ